MRSRKIILWTWTGFLLLAGCVKTFSQIIDDVRFPFEYVSWGERPEYIRSIYGFRWMSDRGNQSSKNIGSGRSDVFPLSTSLNESGVDYFVRFEFTKEDSGLVAVTMLASGLTGFIEVPEEFIDLVWETNMERFGEPTGGKWIPLIGESKEWTVEDVFIKMIRMHLPLQGVLVKYVLQEATSGSDSSRIHTPASPIR